MDNQFKFNYPGDKQQLIFKIKNAIGNKGSLIGNEQQGNFKGNTPIGSFEGDYAINGNDIVVTIHKKPFLVSNSRIRDEFEKALKNA